MKSFKELGVKDFFVKALDDLKINKPTEIQEKSIPYLLDQGTDFIGQAQTGTGKTAAFGLPLLQRIEVKEDKIQALVLAPTRELGQQIAKQLFKFTKYAPNRIFVEGVFGGEKIDDQIFKLQRTTHIVVATPGRLVDLLERKAIDLSYVETIVLDEADEMLTMGFKDDLDKILAKTIGSRNTWLFSATIPDNLQEIIKKYISIDAFKVAVNKVKLVSNQIEHQFVACEPKYKFSTLVQFLSVQRGASGIVFCRTKVGCQKLVDELKTKKFDAVAIHGDMEQREREKSMRIFKKHNAQLLITTDVSARGIDVDDLNYVIHYDLPEKMENYTHRSGRTGRAGKKGISICIVENTEIKKIRKIEESLKIRFTRITAK